MPAASPSKNLRDALRARMLKRIDELGLSPKDAAESMGFDRQQMWRFMAGEDLYSFDRLVEAAGPQLGIALRGRKGARDPPPGRVEIGVRIGTVGH